MVGSITIKKSSKRFPSLELEHSLVSRGGYRFVVGVDEVGRGALAGPVCVGVAVLDFETEVNGWPAGLQDSKLLSESAREEMAPLVAAWVNAWAVGQATVAQIEALGIIRALSIAAADALGQLKVIGLNRRNTVLLLDGKHNWLSPVANGVPVVTEVKADQTAVSVASASIMAKVHRDSLMRQADEQYPGFGFAGNKGYASPEHTATLRNVGPSQLHRMSWLEKILAEPTT